MKVLSLFVDESGDFGEYSTHSPYYIVSILLHDQSVDISQYIQQLNKELKLKKYYSEVIHTEPLIRREEDYKYMTPNERRTLLIKLYHFMLQCDIQYKTFIFRKKEYDTSKDLEKRMKKEIFSFIQENLEQFYKYDKIILYYDNGQYQLSNILEAVFRSTLPRFEIRKVFPKDYKLFQVADLICTLELVNLKADENKLTKSEKLIFHSRRDLKKDFLKGLRRKKIR